MWCALAANHACGRVSNAARRPAATPDGPPDLFGRASHRLHQHAPQLVEHADKLGSAQGPLLGRDRPDAFVQQHQRFASDLEETASLTAVTPHL